MSKLKEIHSRPDNNEKEKRELQNVIQKWWLDVLREYGIKNPQIRLPQGNVKENLFLTREPGKVFGPSEGYHVTSSYVLRHLAKGLPIIPPFLHPQAGVVTHRKSALLLADAFLSLFQIDMSSKQSFVFGGPQVDAQQVVIEGHIAKNIGNPFGLDRFSGSIFSKLDLESGDPILRTELVEMFKHMALSGGGLSDVLLTTHRDLICQILKTLTLYAGFRDGWFAKVMKVFKGKVGFGQDLIDHMDNSEYLLDHLMPAYDKWRQTLSGKTGDLQAGVAMIIKYDLADLWRQFEENQTPYPVVQGSRHPHQIHIMPFLPPASINTIYVDQSDLRSHDDIKHLDVLREQFNIQVKEISELAAEKFIDSITPEAVGSIENIDPEKPLCAVRYNNEDPKEFFANLIRNGTIFHEQNS